MDMSVTLCAGILKSEYCHWGPSRAVQAEKLVVNCMTFFKNSMLSKIRFFSKVIFKVNLNVFFFHDLYALNVIFFLQPSTFCTKTHVGIQI